jgi:hypothetical protein
MMDKQTIIDFHNLQTIEEYRKRQKERKAGDSNSPVRLDEKPAPLRVKPSPEFNIVSHLIRTQPINFSPTMSPMMRATYGHSQGDGKSSRALENIINSRCMLAKAKAVESQPYPTPKLRRGGSFGVLHDDMDEPIDEPRFTATISSPPQNTSLYSTPHRILNQNSQYKTNRSSSVNKKSSSTKTMDTNPPPKPERSTFKEMVELKTKTGHTEKEKKSKFIDSFKEMISFKSFSKKKPCEKAADSLIYFCGCTLEKKFKNLKHEFGYGCVRSVGWLRNKFMSSSAHAELKKGFFDKFEGKTVSQSIRENIEKDVVRTFSSNKYLSSEAVRSRLQRLLECVALVYPHIGYVQGMNFIAATLLYHCDEFCSLSIIRILFEQLELKDMFLPSKGA